MKVLYQVELSTLDSPMAKIFISYSRKDSKAARKIIEACKAIEQDVWVDWEDIPPAADWLEQIFLGIEGADAFLFLVSPDSIASEVCNVEVGHAAKNSKRIIPIVVRDVDPKAAKVNPIIGKLNWTFIRKADNFDEGMTKVKVAIELDLPWVEEHNRLQARALDWHRKKEPSLLLRGRDLRNARHMVDAATSKDPTPTDLQKTYIQHSARDERRRMSIRIAAGVAIVIMAVLSYYALVQARLATANEFLANQNRDVAEKNAALALDNERQARNAQRQAEEAQRIAEENKKIAEAQRSVAKAQIYQSRPGELYTSTLLAIDSWQRKPSMEAEEILRKNISLLPIPVAQMSRAGAINSLEFSPDGNTFVTASADGSACVWNVKDEKELFCAPGSGSVNDAMFGPKGDILVTGDNSGLVQILDAKNGDVQNEFNYGVPVWNVNIRPDGKLLAITRDDGKITIIDLNTRKESYNLQAFGNLYVSAFSPNGDWIAAGSNIGGVTLWNLTDGKIITSGRHKGAVLTLEFSPNSKFLVSGGADGAAVMVNTASGEELFRVLHDDWVESIAFSPDGSWFVSASDDRRIRVWDARNGDERVRMSQDSFVQTVEVSSNGQWIATTGTDKTVRVWNASSGAEIFQIPLKDRGGVLAFSKNGDYLVSGDDSGEINTWNISMMSAPANYVQFKEFTGNVKFSPSGDWVAASDANRIWLLALPDGQLSNLTPRPQGEPALRLSDNIYDLVVSPDSKWLGISTNANEYLLYNVDNQYTNKITPTSEVYALAFTADSAHFITGGTDGDVQQWDVKTGKLERSLVQYESGVTALAVNSNYLAVALTDKISILDMNSGQGVTEIEALGDHQLLAFNPQGKLLTAADVSGQIKIWKFENAAFSLLQSISKEQAVSISFNPQGNLLAVGTINNVYLIDPITGEEVARIPHKDSVNNVSFSPDGSVLATASLKVVQFWDVAKLQNIETADLIQAACARLIQNFSASQWNALFGNEEYRKLCKNLPVP